MTRWLTDDEQDVWRAWLSASHRLEAHLARAMQAAGEISMADFAVLAQLTETDEGRLRAFELGRALQWEKSRLSHHLTRMQARGLVERRDCGTDRRGAFVLITPAGRAAIESAAPAHVDEVRAAFFDRLTPEQISQLGAACAAVAAGLDPDEGCPPVACDS